MKDAMPADEFDHIDIPDVSESRLHALLSHADPELDASIRDLVSSLMIPAEVMLGWQNHIDQRFTASETKTSAS